MRLYVNIYSVGRAYGGPEEGGWWYDVGHPIGAIPVELTDEEWQVCRVIAMGLGILDTEYNIVWSELNEKWLEENPGQDDLAREGPWRDLLQGTHRSKAEEVKSVYKRIYSPTGKRSSVIGGEDYDVVIEDHFPKAYPESTPRYE